MCNVFNFYTKLSSHLLLRNSENASKKLAICTKVSPNFENYFKLPIAPSGFDFALWVFFLAIF